MSAKETLVWWDMELTDGSTVKLTDRQMRDFLEAEHRGARFIRIGDKIINPAYVKGSEKTQVERDEFAIAIEPLKPEERIYLIVSANNKQLPGKVEK